MIFSTLTVMGRMACIHILPVNVTFVTESLGVNELSKQNNFVLNVYLRFSQWRIIGGSMMCCGNQGLPMNEAVETYDTMQKDKEYRNFQHPTDSQIALTTHTPLYIPGRIIHVVRNHPPGSE